MELKLGKMTNAELAAWYNITLGSYNNNRQKKLQELRQYADFTVVRGGVVINQIYYKTYLRNQSKIGQEVRTRLPEVWPAGEPHTCTQVGNLLYETRQNDGALSTYEYQVRKQRTVLVGKPGRENPYCHYEMVKGYYGETEGKKRYECLTPAEKDIVHNIWCKYFQDGLDMVLMTDLMMYGKDSEIVRILKEEAKFSQTKYQAYIQEVALTLHCDMFVRATVIVSYKKNEDWSDSDEIDEKWIASVED